MTSPGKGRPCIPPSPLVTLRAPQKQTANSTDTATEGRGRVLLFIPARSVCAVFRNAGRYSLYAAIAIISSSGTVRQLTARYIKHWSLPDLPDLPDVDARIQLFVRVNDVSCHTTNMIIAFCRNKQLLSDLSGLSTPVAEGETHTCGLDADGGHVTHRSLSFAFELA